MTSFLSSLALLLMGQLYGIIKPVRKVSPSRVQVTSHRGKRHVTFHVARHITIYRPRHIMSHIMSHFTPCVMSHVILQVRTSHQMISRIVSRVMSHHRPFHVTCHVTRHVVSYDAYHAHHGLPIAEGWTKKLCCGARNLSAAPAATVLA